MAFINRFPIIEVKRYDFLKTFYLSHLQKEFAKIFSKKVIDLTLRFFFIFLAFIRL